LFSIETREIAVIFGRRKRAAPKLYSIESDQWFTDSNVEGVNFAVIAFKELATKDPNKKIQNRLFYHEQTMNLTGQEQGSIELKRGFKGRGVPHPNSNLSGTFLSQKDQTGTFTVHAHLVIAKNPFDDLGLTEKHHVIILNGVSGPATFALTHVLTGGMSSQFVAYENDFDPNSESEAFLKDVNKAIYSLNQDNVLGVQYFFEVSVGPPSKKNDSVERHIFDWRRILRWKRVGVEQGPIFKA
jgi:hypothetical protein